jgi:hypothetical protein
MPGTNVTNQEKPVRNETFTRFRDGPEQDHLITDLCLPDRKMSHSDLPM